MAGRPGITIVDVARACVALSRQKRRIGPSNVRLELGRGSMTTISRHLHRLAIRDFNEKKPIKKAAYGI
ncbi:DNA-binding protein [Massilia sp. Root133]|uniref:DNA-binding protein n=1 Tax=Massilia sp. Root133 TaxID=1736455 RepID=UPI00138ED751